MTNKIEFTSVHAPFNVHDAIRIYNECAEYYMNYIVKYNIKKIELRNVIDTGFLKKCNNISHLSYFLPNNMLNKYDSKVSNNVIVLCLDGIHSLVCLKQLNLIEGDDGIKINQKIDLACFQELEYLSSSYHRIKNLEKTKNVRTLVLNYYDEENLDSISKLYELDTLKLTSSKIRELSGMSYLKRMQCLYLFYNRQLSDISSLVTIKKTLKTLVIENCPKIQNFSVLSQLENLEHLELVGNNNIPDLSFLKNIKNLKTLIISMNVLDGDLSLCLDIPYVYILKGRKHYNYSDKHMRKEKDKYAKGNENIPEWRRLY
ncbi:MAG: hypothetical protein IKY26_10040 [Erysipelotrichaceae bacterium]|nr:hypothetical protein [Erysipelotrichaceae bacterium]